MKPISENAMYVAIVALIVIAALAVVGGFTYTANKNNVKEKELATLCIEQGGSWTLPPGGTTKICDNS